MTAEHRPGTASLVQSLSWDAFPDVRRRDELDHVALLESGRPPSARLLHKLSSRTPSNNGSRMNPVPRGVPPGDYSIFISQAQQQNSPSTVRVRSRAWSLSHLTWENDPPCRSLAHVLVPVLFQDRSGVEDRVFGLDDLWGLGRVRLAACLTWCARQGLDFAQVMP